MVQSACVATARVAASPELPLRRGTVISATTASMRTPIPAYDWVSSQFWPSAQKVSPVCADPNGRRKSTEMRYLPPMELSSGIPWRTEVSA